jgi:transcription factor 1
MRYVICTDDILKRLSPYLLRKPAVDILDLWPGGGLWSSKINDLLKPRRHVLIEPDLKTFKPLLQPLAQSRPCYELLSTDIHAINDWKSLLSIYFPEQEPSDHDDRDSLPKNDTLLILANPPPTGSKKDHYTPARWWSVFMETCMRQSGLHTYGSVRMIASLPVADAQAVIPRTVAERKRPALLTENVALHAFEVAGPKDPSMWVAFKGWDVVADNASRVAQRAAEQGVTTPRGREIPPIPMAPESPDPGRLPVPYVPRTCTEFHEKLMQKINSSTLMAADSATSGKGGKRNQTRMRALIQLNKENRDAYYRQRLANKRAELDELMRTLSRSAADPNVDSTALKPILDDIETVKAAVAQETSDIHYDVLKELPTLIDDKRASLHTGNFDDAVLLWDRRPFEPLLIEPEELFPRNAERSVLYFEADSNPTSLQKVHQLPPDQRDDPFRLFEAYSLTMGTRNLITVAEFLQLIFPDRPINDIVKSIPSLAVFAAKTPKPDFDNLPKTKHGPGENLDPAACYQDNLDYDLSDVRVRCLPSSTLWDIFVDYEKSDMKLSAVQLNRLLGGTLTSFRSGEYLMPAKKYH